MLQDHDEFIFCINLGYGELNIRYHNVEDEDCLNSMKEKSTP